jgi:DNA topoisomerase-3
MQTEEGRWRVEFDEPWAKDGAKPPEVEVENVVDVGAAAAAEAVSSEAA